MAAPPEVHSLMLTTGGTTAGITLSGASWEELSAQFLASIGEVQGVLQNVQTNYQGPSSEKFLQAHAPYLVWLEAGYVKTQLAAAAHAAAVAGYDTAVAAMPTMAELVENHAVHGVLVSTNFLGVNTIPIGFNEGDYHRMWVQAADVMTGWDGVTTAVPDSIPLTPLSPIMVMPGPAEASDAAIDAGAAAAIGPAAAGGAAMNASDMMGNKLLVGKAASSPTSADDIASGLQPNQSQQDQAGSQTQNMASNVVQEMTSIAPQAGQSAASALQSAGPQQLLQQAPEMLSQAPSTLGQLIQQTGFPGAGGLPANVTNMPVGFAGTSALTRMNPAGMTSLAGGAYGSGPTRALMPSSWGAAVAESESAEAAAARNLAPVPSSMGGAGGASSGSGAGGAGMMGNAAARNRRGAVRRNTYSDDEDVDELEEAEVRGSSP
jgi:PPE-repeat protein